MYARLPQPLTCQTRPPPARPFSVGRSLRHATLAVRQTLPRSLEPHAASPPSTRRRATVCLPSASLTLTLAPNPNPNPNPGPTPTWAAHLDQHHPCRTSSPVARAARLCRGHTPAQPKGARRIPALNPSPSAYPAAPSAYPASLPSAQISALLPGPHSRFARRASRTPNVAAPRHTPKAREEYLP